LNRLIEYLADRRRQTDVRQHHRLIPAYVRGHKNSAGRTSAKKSVCRSLWQNKFGSGVYNHHIDGVPSICVLWFIIWREFCHL